MADEFFTEEIKHTWNFTLPPVREDEIPDLSKLALNRATTHRYWNSEKSLCVQFFPDCLTFNLISRPDNIGSFSRLQEAAEHLLPLWRKITDVRHFSELCVEYVNAFTTEHLSPFTGSGGEIQVRNAFTVFAFPSHFGGGDGSLKRPYHHEFTLDLKRSEFPSTVNVKLAIPSTPIPREPDIDIQLLLTFLATYTVGGALVGASLSQAVEVLHQDLSTVFRGILTPSMLQHCGVNPS